MFSSRQKACSQATAPASRPDGWHTAGLRATAEVERVVEAVLTDMAAAGYPTDDQFAMRLALEEACVNAIKHGHGGDPRKRVQVRYHVDRDRVLAEVQDQGPGFDPHRLPDPCAEENLEQTSGRGVFLMRSFMTWIRYNQRGNAVTLCKCRSDR